MRRPLRFRVVSFFVLLTSSFLGGNALFHPLYALDGSEDNPQRATARIPHPTKTPITDGLDHLRKNNLEDAKTLLEPYAQTSPLARAACLAMGVSLLQDELDTHCENATAKEWIEAITWAQKKLYTTKTKLVKGKKAAKDPWAQAIRNEKSKSSNSFICCEIGRFFEEKQDNKEAVKWYQFALQKGGGFEPVLGLARVADAHTQQSAPLKQGFKISIAQLKTWYNACQEYDEGHRFYQMAEKFSQELYTAQCGWLAGSFLKTGALYGDRASLKEYAINDLTAIGLIPDQSVDKIVYWGTWAARGKELDPLRYFTGVLGKDKQADHSHKIFEIFKTLTSFPEANALDYVYYAQRLVDHESAKPWFNKALEKYTNTEEEQKAFFNQGKKLLFKEIWSYAYHFFEKIKDSTVMPEARYYHKICGAEGPIIPLDDPEFEKDPGIFNVLLNLWIKGIMNLNVHQLLKSVETLYTEHPQNEHLSFGHGVFLVCSDNYKGAEKFFLRSIPENWDLDYQSLFACCQHTIATATNKVSFAQSPYIFYEALEKKGNQDGRVALSLYTLEEMLSSETARTSNEVQRRRLERAMKSGLGQAFYEYGLCLMLGKYGMEKSYDEAISSLEIAREKGCVLALSSLLTVYQMKAEQEKLELTEEEQKTLEPYQVAIAQIVLDASQNAPDPGTEESAIDEEDSSASSFASSSPTLSDAEAFPFASPHESGASTLSAPQKPTECPQTQEKQSRDKEKARCALEKFQSQGQLKQRHLQKALNQVRKIIGVALEQSSGSRVYLQMGKQKGGFHRPHGSDSQIVKKGATRQLAKTFKTLLGSSEEILAPI